MKSHRDSVLRLRKLLQTAKANALRCGRAFDDELFQIFAIDCPVVCACCEVALDYAVYPKKGMNYSRAPSVDRCNNDLGYIIGNVYVICFRCNRLKSDASFVELQKLAAYITRHLNLSTVCG